MGGGREEVSNVWMGLLHGADTVTQCGWRESDTVWVEGGRHCVGGGRVTLCGWREGDTVWVEGE